MADPTPTPTESHVENFMDSADQITAQGALKVPGIRLDITALTGGTSTDLDSILSAGVAVDTLLILGVSLGPNVPHQMWVLKAGTNAEDPANGVVRPDDYAASTNEKVWKALSIL